MSGATKKQSLIFRGIYEFEDPSGAMVAAKTPAVGTADLYSGTKVLVKPSQAVIFVYQGQVADVLLSGAHEIRTENVPILTRLANWKFGFESPLRCELIYVSGQVFAARRWGTPQPVLVKFDGVGTVPIRSFGNFNFAISDPKRFYLKLMGSRSAFTIADLEEMVQGQVIELLPSILGGLRTMNDLGSSYNELSRALETAVNSELKDYGIACQKIQILSALPSKEVLEAMDAKTAIQMIGSQKEYLLYKAANSLAAGSESSGNDPMQMMMGLMLGKGLLGADFYQREEKVQLLAQVSCPGCSSRNSSDAKFCSNCGARIQV